MSNVRVPVIWAIRDARGLTPNQKTMLFVIESHGDMYCVADQAMREMGLSHSAYYRTRQQLLDQGLISAKESVRRATTYQVALEAVKALGQGSLQRDPIPPAEHEGPSSGTPGSLQRDTSLPPAGDRRRPEEDQEEDQEDPRGPRHLHLAIGSSDPSPEYLAELRDRVRTRPPTARGAL